MLNAKWSVSLPGPEALLADLCPLSPVDGGLQHQPGGYERMFGVGLYSRGWGPWPDVLVARSRLQTRVSCASSLQARFLSTRTCFPPGQAGLSVLRVGQSAWQVTGTLLRACEWSRSKSVPSSPFTLRNGPLLVLSCSFLPSHVFIWLCRVLVVARRFSVAVWDCLLQLIGAADVVCGPSCPMAVGSWFLTGSGATCPALRPTLSRGPPGSPCALALDLCPLWLPGAVSAVLLSSRFLSLGVSSSLWSSPLPLRPLRLSLILGCGVLFVFCCSVSLEDSQIL